MDVEREIHLFVLVHGLNGVADDLKYIGNQIELQFVKQNIIVEIPTVNHGLTFNGIKQLAERLYEHVIEVIREKKPTHLSLIGHSLGGLVSRYLAYLLYENQIIPTLIPVNFLTIASPHLGSLEFARSVPIPMYYTVISCGASYTTGLTGLELMQTDAPTNLLYKMTTEDFISALLLFKHHICFGNVRYDTAVGYATACIRRKNPFADDFPGSTTKFGITIPPTQQIIIEDTVEIDQYPTDDHSLLEEFMMNQLNKIPWKRYAVFPSRMMMAHIDVVVKNEAWMEQHGKVSVNFICKTLFENSKEVQ